MQIRKDYIFVLYRYYELVPIIIISISEGVELNHKKYCSSILKLNEKQNSTFSVFS